jgi:hypothetical protein
MSESNEPRVLHCWADKREVETEELEKVPAAERDSEWWGKHCDAFLQKDSICLLPAGHEGPHDWVLGEDITVTFAASPTEATTP